MATLATNVSFQCLGLDGKPLAGGKVYTYEAGATTPKNTYTTHEGDVPNTNPVILDQNGKAKIFLGDGAYRMRVLDSNDALIDDIDQISRYVTQSEFATFQQSVQDGVDQLTEVREQIDVFVNTAISNQKGYANGIAPLDPNQKLDPMYLPALPNDAIPQATPTVVGVAKLVNALNSTDDKAALTAAKGKELNDKMFGVGQTYKDVTSSRSVNTVFTNPSSKPIFLSIDVSIPAGTTARIYCGTLEVASEYSFLQSGASAANMYAVIGPQEEYRLTGATIRAWKERS